MKKIAPWLFGVYCLLCISPYFISAFNTIAPRLFGIPFTVWSIWLLVGLCCWLLRYLSNHVWESYDGPAETKNEGDTKQ